jgi:hypothetical protein
MSGTGKTMLLKDRFELPVTCATAAAVEDYAAAVDLLLSAWPGAEMRLNRALSADPDFALAPHRPWQTAATAGAHTGGEGGSSTRSVARRPRYGARAPAHRRNRAVDRRRCQ